MAQQTEYSTVAERLRRSTVQVRLTGRREAGGGSGVIWNADGLIVTNAHVTRSSQATVELWDGRELAGTVTAMDARRDLALIRVEAQNLPAAAAGDSEALRVGELVIAVGNPLGFSGAVSTGVIHALGPVRGVGRQTWVQADVRLAPGNSGGPLADAHGRVIGINTMVLTGMRGGLALAVPSAAVQRFVRRGGSGSSLGVVVRPVQVEKRLGLLVLEVVPKSAAERASLLVGDVLVAAQGRAFRETDDLSAAIEEAAGGSLSLQFLRGGKQAVREVVARLEVTRAEAA